MKQIAVLLCCLLALPAVASSIELEWDPVNHPLLEGYRVSWSGPTSGEMDVTGPAVLLDGLPGNCGIYTIAVRSLATTGVVSEPATIVGMPAPEIASVEIDTTGLRLVHGDNFAPDAVVWLDPQGPFVDWPAPIQPERIDCQTLRLPGEPQPFLTLYVVNPGDGNTVDTYSIPLPKPSIHRSDSLP